MVTARPGHSLPELIVAMTLMAATMAGVASTAVLGARWTTDAGLRQRALVVAGMVVDSLAGMAETPSPGEVVRPPPGLTVRWGVEPLADMGAARLRVAVLRGDEQRILAELHGLWVAPLPGPLP
jgi:type II secretory pathway pseudopilin PulG